MKRQKPGCLLTVNDVAERLAVKTSWVYAAVERDPPGLPHLRVGRYVRFERDAIEEYIQAHRRGPGARKGHAG